MAGTPVAVGFGGRIVGSGAAGAAVTIGTVVGAGVTTET